MSLRRRLPLVVLTAVIVLSAGLGSAGAQESGDEEVPTVLPSVPREVSDRLPEDPSQRHPWISNDAPWPWNYSIAQGTSSNSNGTLNNISCTSSVASENPYWYQENMRYTRWNGGSRCNVEMRAITGTARLHQWNGAAGTGAQLAEAAIGAQQAVPPGYGSGWQAYSDAYYTRTSDEQNLQIQLSVTLELHYTGTGSRWNTVPHNCTRDPNMRIIHCQLWSAPFRNAPYPCPSPKLGVQPTRCENPPQLCPSGQYGAQPNCFASPQLCPNGQYGIQPNCVTPPGLTPPRNTSPPTIAGNAQRGAFLVGDSGTWEGEPSPNLSPQWLRCSTDCVEIEGAMNTRYRVRMADLGKTLAVRFTARNGLGTAEATSSRTPVVTDDPDAESCPVGALEAPPYCDDASEPCRAAASQGGGAAASETEAAEDAYISANESAYPNDTMADSEEATVVRADPSDSDTNGGAAGAGTPSNAEGCPDAVARYAGFSRGNRAERSYCISEPLAMNGSNAIRRREDCREAFDAANRAAKMARERFGARANEGYMGDAFRHCAWNGRMVQRMDLERARKFAELHEEGGPRDRMWRMDIWNNEAGQNQGSVLPNARTLYNVCTGAAKGRNSPTLLIACGKGKNMEGTKGCD